jgi:NAD(P)-dependent dehydrogenase (short-subunit alcohol dehydrogenase family)
MRVLLVGATGTIGRAVVAALEGRHEVVPVSFHKAAVKLDLASLESIAAMYRQVGAVDAVVCAAGQAKFAPFADLTDADFAFSVANKLMGQVNLVRLGSRPFATRVPSRSRAEFWRAPRWSGAGRSVSSMQPSKALRGQRPSRRRAAFVSTW